MPRPVIPNVRVLFLVGPPNSGKSTQAELLAKESTSEAPVFVVSPGEWLRSLSAQHETHDLGAFIFHNWSHEALTPLVTDYLDRSIGDLLDQPPASNFIIVVDGFPRSVSEAQAIPRIIRGHLAVVIELNPGDDVIRARGEDRQRGTDDTADAMDIRSTSYATNITDIQESLKALGIACLRVPGNETRQRVNIILKAVLENSSCMSRVPIPSWRPKKTLARKLFSEADAIDSATIVQRALRLARSTRLRRQFFGTHPISLTRVNLPRLRRYPYLVALKATGVRFMCMVSDSRIWLISRALIVYVSSRIEGLEKFTDTLLDGELIGMEEASMYVVLDCLAANGKNCMRDPIMERLRRSVDLGKFMFNGPLFFRPQEYVDRGQLPQLIRRAKELPWKIDGVILQPARLPYRLGIDYNMFKWKPLGENSADFYYNEEDSGLYCRVSVGEAREDAPTPVDVTTAPKITKKKVEMIRFGRLLKCLTPPWIRDGMIIECVALPAEGIDALMPDIEETDWNSNELVWVPQQHRGDKPTANIDWVAQSVIQSIIDNITQPELEQECTASNISSHELPQETARLIPHADNHHKKRSLY